MSENADGSRLDLPAEVTKQIVTELSDQGKKALAALRTAAVLIEQALHDETGLRFAESAVYNLREALDAVVAGRTPVPGGLPMVIEAWEQFEREVAQPGNDGVASLETFGVVVRRATERQDRNSYHEAKLLGYLRYKSGVEPLSGSLNPIAEYKRLRGAASKGLHRETALESAIRLYQGTLAWFVRMFTPPDAVVWALRELATEPWLGPDQIVRLRKSASNPHHIRFFFAHLVDPAWLDPLYEADVVPLPPPDPEAPWPVAGLLEGLGRTAPAAVSTLAQRLLAGCKRLPVEQRLDARFKLLMLATQLGPDGHTIIGDIATAHPNIRAVRSLATGAVKRADPADPIVERVSEIVLNDGPSDRDSYYYRLLLDQMETGMNLENAETRTRMVTAKLRHAARQHDAGWVNVDLARLTTDLGEDDRAFLVVISHYLARMVVRARALGVPNRQLLEGVADIPGEVGERLACRVLALADDMPLQDKIDHITLRLASQTATGDDQDLVDVVLAATSNPAQLAAWTDALGSPSPPPTDPAVLPRDWRRAWRWSAILPEYLLTRWQEPIATVSARHGRIDPRAFDRRTLASYAMWGQSAYSTEDLAALPVLDAARLVTGWRPDAESDLRSIGARELARTLQAAVIADPQAWAADPAAVVETLREPLYVLHYFLALTEKAADILPRTGEIITAAQLATTEKWPPMVLGNDDYDFEPDWQGVNTATVDLITALADHDAPFAEHLDTAWSWALSALNSSPADTDNITIDNALRRANTNPRGGGLKTVLSLAHWEHRNTTAIRPEFFGTLDNLIQVTGPVGMDYRAILASQRPRLEHIAQDWLDRRIDILFRDGSAGQATLDLTLKHASRTTPWLHQNLRDDIIAAALRGTENAAVSLLVGTLVGAPGYDVDTIIAALRKDTGVLADAVEHMAHLVQNSPDNAAVLATGVEFWQAMLDANRDVVPVDVLRRSGRWAFITDLPENVWAPLMVRTLDVTNGLIDYAIEVADRCEAAPMPGDSTRILLQLQGRGEAWEQHYVANVALNTLRTLSTGRPDDNFLALRTKLIEIGHAEATYLTPYDDD
jgi:hypothetical protein